MIHGITADSDGMAHGTAADIGAGMTHGIIIIIADGMEDGTLTGMVTITDGIRDITILGTEVI